MYRTSAFINFITSFLLGALFLVVYLSLDMSALKTTEVQVDVKEYVKHLAYSQPRCQRNMTAANINGFSSLPQEIQDFLYYRHCRHFPMILDLPDKCGGVDRSADIFLLLVIKSSPINYERRQVLRKTWAQERSHKGRWIRRIFISGTMDVGLEKERLNKLLKSEQQEYNDILQWDFADTFFNLTLKQILFLEWMDRNCPKVRFLLNGDDDVFAHTENMVEYLQGLSDNDGSKHLYTGYLIPKSFPVRWEKSKYFVPVQVYELETYPPYCGGGGFLLSGYTAAVIYKVSKSVPFLPIDDVYMGLCLTKEKLPIVAHMGVWTLGWHVPSRKLHKYDPCLIKEMLLVHRFLPADMYVTWQQVQDPNLKCGVEKWPQETKTVTFRW